MKRLSLLAAGVLVAATLSAPAASADDEPPVSFALATVDADADNSHVGYGFASNTPALFYRYDGAFAFRNWPEYAPDNAAFADTTGNLLVLRADIESDTFEATTYDGGTLATLSHHSTAIDTADEWRVTGFYYGPDDHIYALQSRSNPSEQLDKIVVRILKYDRSLTLLGTADVAADEVTSGLYEPDAAGLPSMTLVDHWLVVHTSREMFQDGGGLHHESNVTYLVDTTTMTAEQTATAVYASHSMNQHIAVRGNDAVFVDHGDAYPRAIQLAVAPDYFTDPPAYDEGDTEVSELVTIPGGVGENFTGVTINGLGVGTDRALITGVAEHRGSDMGGGSGDDSIAADLYLLSADLDSGTATRQWLTSAGSTSWVGQPTLTPLGDGTFALLYSVNSLDHGSVSMHYRRVDEDGQTLTEKVWIDRELGATSTPVKVGNRLYWVGAGCAAGEVPAFSSNCSGAYVFGLDLTDPAAPVALGHAVAGGPGDPGGGDQVQDDRSFPARAKVLKPSGKAKVGKRLTAVVSGFPSGTTFRYQWYVGGKAVVGATASSFKIKKKVTYTKRGKTKKLATKGKAVKVSVTARRSGYVTATYTSPATKVKQKK